MTNTKMYNRELLMCRPDFFRIAYSINPYMKTDLQPDRAILEAEYEALVEAHRAAGRTIHFLVPHPDFPDMTFTANQALIRGNKAVLGNLPPERAGEVAYTKTWLEAHGKEVVESPYLLSGQGDSLPTGTGAVIKGREWRSDPRSDAFVADYLGYEVIPIHAISNRYYDDDIIISILRPGLIAVCFEALDLASQQLLRSRDDLEIIPVPLEETNKFVQNLVSDGQNITMPVGAPRLEKIFEQHGFNVVPLPITQLMLGGGGIRCTTLALDAF